MSFNEVIPCSTIGDMLSNEMITNYSEVSKKVCYTCGCRVSIYNSSDRCFPCRTKDKESVIQSINEIFDEVNDE